MLEILKKTYLAGADLAAKTWDEVELLSKEGVKKKQKIKSDGRRERERERTGDRRRERGGGGGVCGGG